MILKDLGEFGLIRRLKKKLASHSSELMVGINDDAAVFKAHEQLSLLTTDAFVEGVHFDLKYMSFHDVGWRLLAANLSDIAAMGGIPEYAVLTVALRDDLTVGAVDDFYRGMSGIAQQFSVDIIGGDTTRTPDRLFFSLTIYGRVERERLVLRSGAREEDAVLVTGSPGNSIAGLEILKLQRASLLEKFPEAVKQHRTPQPRVREARHLVENFHIHAMIDVSDGVASEIGHVCQSSDVGARLYADKIPLSAAARNIAEMQGAKPLSYALYGGEDFELLFTAPKSESTSIIRELKTVFNLQCSNIGKITSLDKGVMLIDGERAAPLAAQGFDHFRPTLK